ncbi:MAG: hypothetical protein R3D82_16095 [Xanthobacteraceae bacterium]
MTLSDLQVALVLATGRSSDFRQVTLALALSSDLNSDRIFVRLAGSACQVTELCKSLFKSSVARTAFSARVRVLLLLAPSACFDIRAFVAGHRLRNDSPSELVEAIPLWISHDLSRQ